MHREEKCNPACRRDRGATMVECTIVLPIFFVLVFAVFDFSRFVLARAEITSALRRSGEYAATFSGDCLTPPRNRFFSVAPQRGTDGDLVFVGAVIPFTGNGQALQLTATGIQKSALLS